MMAIAGSRHLQNIGASRHYAIWVPELETSGEYDIAVYIPSGLDVNFCRL